MRNFLMVVIKNHTKFSSLALPPFAIFCCKDIASLPSKGQRIEGAILEVRAALARKLNLLVP